MAMGPKPLIWIFMIIGSTLGSYIPTLWGAGFLSTWSVILSAAGGLLGIWLGFKLSN